MTDQTVNVFAKWRIKEGSLENVLAVLPELVELTTGEPGNLRYEIYRSNADANTLLLVESYVDTAAAEAHRKSEHFQRLVVGQIVPLLELREVVHVTRIMN